MLKKSILGVVLLALVAMPAYAANPIKDYGWPCEFKFVDICEIPIEMNVGLYVEILDCDKLKIVLDQEDIDTYKGKVTIQIKSNFNLILGCYVKDNAASKAMGGSFTCTVTPSAIPATLCACVAEADVEVVYDDVKIVHHEFGKNVPVGTAVVQVKPGFDCDWVDP